MRRSTRRFFAKFILVMILSGVIIAMYGFPYLTVTILAIAVFGVIVKIIMEDDDFTNL